MVIWLTRCSFFDEALRIAASDYIPIEADVLRARTKTTGIYETRFSMGQLSIQYVECLYYGNWPILTKAPTACLMSEVNEVNVRNGFTASKM